MGDGLTGGRTGQPPLWPRWDPSPAQRRIPTAAPTAFGFKSKSFLCTTRR